MVAIGFLFALSAASIVSARSLQCRDGDFPKELDALFQGHRQFRAKVAAEFADVIASTAKKQAPPFYILGCSDSRASEGTVFNAEPGMLFAHRNIANQFYSTDANVHSGLAYAVTELGVKHVLVMGHYGCGGIAAATTNPPKGPLDASSAAIQSWIAPIRDTYKWSTRTEVVEMRQRNGRLSEIPAPKLNDTGFRALIEENVKDNVRRVAESPIIVNHYLALNSTGRKREERGGASDVFIHGLVYDIETGEVKDLGVSVGPPGKAIPSLPFGKV
ncbi:carbonic anhydrase [Infundibulicybe gibba]|nr:carbonic anhydrase [Infundibulicybe gibba]